MDVFYCTTAGSVWNNSELLLSIRSLERHGRGIGAVFYLGENPGFLGGEMPCISTPGMGTPEGMIAGINAAFEKIRRFILIENRHFVLRDVDLSRWPSYHSGNMATGSTKSALVALGLELWSMADAPIVLDREIWRSMSAIWARARNLPPDFCVRTFYRANSRVRSFILPDSEIASWPLDEIKTRTRSIVSCTNSGYETGFAEFLKTKYTIKSRFEL